MILHLILIKIYLIGLPIAYLRYCAVWNQHKHISITYLEVIIISLMSWLTIIGTIPHLFTDKPLKIFDYKLRQNDK